MPHVTVSAPAMGSSTLTKPPGLVSDLWTVTDAVTTSGSAVVTSASSGFATAAQGQAITINGAGVAAAQLETTIASRQSSGQITLAVNAGTSVPAGAYAVGGTDNAAMIEAAIAGGAKNIWLPARTLWVVTGGVTPNNVTVQGEDWETVVVRSPSLANLLLLGTSTHWINVSFFDRFSFDLNQAQVWAGSHRKARPARFLANTDTAHTYPPANFPYQAFTIVTGLQSSPTQDRPGFTVTNWGIGGSYYTQLFSDTAPGFHVEVNSVDPSKAARGVLVWNYGAGQGVEVWGMPGSTGRMVYLEARADVKSLVISPTVATGRDIDIQTTTKTTGQIIYIRQDTSAYVGQAILIDGAQTGGSFGGQFLLFRIGGVAVFRVDGAGRLLATTSSKAGLPVAADIPAGQFAIYKDTSGGSLRLWANDGGTLKSVTLA